MSDDISLSQSLGGLRIANPDNDSTPSPPPAPAPEEPSPPADVPQSSSASSAGTITDTQDAAEPPHLLQPIPTESSASTLDFNPGAFSASQTSLSPPSSSTPPIPDDHSQSSQQNARLNHRQSMPIAHQAQMQAQYGPQGPPSLGQPPRNYGPSAPPSRPTSSFYTHPNASSGSGVAPQGSYRYNDMGLIQPSVPGLSRSSSRAAAAAMQAAGLPTRESSRSYRQPHQQLGGNGPLPPRRSSRRSPMGPGPPGASYGPEGMIPQSSEDWKDKGAAVGVRQEMDANGKPISRVVKKGVKDFNFGRTLGEGSYSTVLAATDRQTLREYAIKVLDKRHIIKEKKVKYVNIEKDTLNRLTEHPGIVRLYYTFQDERSLYFVLDLASGGELLGFLKKIGTFDEECARYYGAQILDAIDYMHSRGIIHRDLKPENVLLDDQMHVKITDFGTAKILSQKRSANGEGTAGDPLEGAESDRAESFVGTAEYVSPELLTDKNACKASDLWAFGCIIYQLLSGRPPFKAGNEYQTFQKIVNLEYTFPDQFPEAARDLVERLLVLDPAKRLPIEHIKTHQFFDGIQWGRGLWKQKAPRLKPYQPPPPGPIKLNGHASSLPPHMAGLGAPRPGPSASNNTTPRPSARVITELPPPSQLDIDWSPVLTRNNERILKLGNLIVTSAPAPHSPHGESAPEAPKKFSRFFGGSTTKKRQRLVMITSAARLILAAAGGEEKKAKLDLSLLGEGTAWRSYKDAKGITAWCIDTKDKHLIFEDPKATPSDPEGSKYTAQEWLDALEQAKDFAASQSMANSYSGDSTFNELSSTISSPASTLGGDSALDGVNIPTSRHLRKGDHGDSESIKGRKRFSKRHSKNGLAAVF